jgi:hypothetical protein
VVTPDAFRAAWDALQSCGAFSVRVAAVPPAAVIAAHLRRQCFAVVASGMIADRTKVANTQQYTAADAPISAVIRRQYHTSYAANCSRTALNNSRFSLKVRICATLLHSLIRSTARKSNHTVSRI